MASQKKPVVDPSQGRNHVDYGRRERFQAAYETLRKAPEKEMEKLLKMLEDNSREEKPNDGRERSGRCFHSDREWNEAVGGKWALGLPLKPGQMLKLAESNYDHFQPNAKEAYVIGHQLAVEKAREAANSDELRREKLLCEAYSIDAFACHFLTDCFASGHIRTPRVELGKNITPANIGHLLSKYMHDKDNKFGLRVTNVRGDKWISYGDGMLLERNDEKNLHLAVEAVQKSVDQVHEAYQNSKATLSSTAVTDLIPFVDEGEKNNSPLFKVKDGRLHRRSDINDFQDQKTVTNWWGTTTAALLLRHKPGNSAIQESTIVK